MLRWLGMVSFYCLVDGGPIISLLFTFLTHLSFSISDPPGAIGCTRCVVNDLDLSVKTATGTKYPNGLNTIDTKNTVERVKASTTDGEEVRIIVDARNFVDKGQKYSLAITDCFSEM